jgi:histidinol-phosphatase (PHP family)
MPDSSPYKIDYHIHTSLSDGSGVHEEYIDQAIRIGLSEIGFSDHVCLRNVPWAIRHERMQEMSEIMNALKGSVTAISVKYGIEVDYFPEQEEEIARMIESLPVDYVIGSIHFLGSWNFDSAPSGYDDWDLGNLYEYYFSLVSKAAHSGLFDTLGHVDLIKKFNFRPDGGSASYYRESIKAIKEAGIAVELNTSGMDKPCREFYPSRAFLEMCKEHKIPITFGSDAHNPGQVGRYCQEAVELLLNVGYRELATFNGRKRGKVALSHLLVLD